MEAGRANAKSSAWRGPGYARRLRMKVVQDGETFLMLRCERQRALKHRRTSGRRRYS